VKEACPRSSAASWACRRCCSGRGGGDEGGHGDLRAVRRRGDMVRKEAAAVHLHGEG
jgi:hypothetical protein